ncbi:MAG: bifunctional proline dehydrogenase/L-glutamate gamma-semialdehyde dehydrogenase [Pirellulales bacterium]
MSAQASLTEMNIKSWLQELGLPHGDDDALKSKLVDAALEFAKVLQKRAMELQTPQERRQQAELDRMIQLPQDKATLTQMTDQSFRSNSPDRVVDQMVHILDVQGVPRFFSPLDRTLLKGFQSFGGYLPGVAVPLVKEKMRKETANVILPAEQEMLREHLKARREEGLRMNVNFLGEAMLGEKEARRRLDGYLAALQMPEIECVSVKISTLYSQIAPIARKATLRILSERLELLYRAANKENFVRRDGKEVPKFVYLDMEEYRDMRLTTELFIQTLSKPGMEQVRAGIALQAYIPDSFLVLEELTEWAKQRVASGGSPITVRIVKGANMEMERVEASLRGWPQAPYKSKMETDANYKRMVEYGMRPEHIEAVRLGVASHNLFDVAYALILASHHEVMHHVQFEMLEGMANHQRRALFEACQSVLLYAPACHREEFINAIGYLIRRLDENTGPDNFLRHAFKIEVGGPTWQRLETGFRESARMTATVSKDSRRKQDRNVPPTQPAAPPDWQHFQNEPDTDFALPQNSVWANGIVDSWKGRCDANATVIPVVVGGADCEGKGDEYHSMDPSRPGVVVAKYRQASVEQIQESVRCAKADAKGWRHMSPTDRFAVLRSVAHLLRCRRADLMGAALADGGKTLMESDPEVSEAVDFVEFYARCALDLYQTEGMRVQPKGTVVVISPWNFPIAIPCGGIAAALAAGNTVVLKPASDTVLPAYVLCQCFWDAGVPREALQLLPCPGSLAGKYLIGDPDVHSVILTGGTDTALRMLGQHPPLHLLAETGGKNATIVSSLSDRDQVIKNVLHSAFSHAGQKCSATSLLLLEEEVFHDQGFRDQLLDAISSLKVGSAWNLSSKMGPLIRPPEGALLRGLKELEHGEVWAAMPTCLEDNPCLYSPGVKWNVQSGSFTHCTELFGPVLGVMKYRKLAEAVDMVNATGFGLTSGLESLDDREQVYWRDRIRAGNLYINRSTTGAIVLRQPFGGMGKSAFGPGIKAGGPNYVIPLVEVETTSDHGSLGASKPLLRPLAVLWEHLHDSQYRERLVRECQWSDEDWSQLVASLESFDRFARDEIRGEHDTFKLIGQDNVRRYLPKQHVRIRVVASDPGWTILARAAAAIAAGARVTVSREDGVYDSLMDCVETLTHDWAGDIEFIEETDAHLCQAIQHGQVDRLRYADSKQVPMEVRKAAIDAHIHIVDSPVTPFGRIELLWYVEEQSVCFDYHRYGNLGVRSTESRSEPL